MSEGIFTTRSKTTSNSRYITINPELDYQGNTIKLLFTDKDIGVLESSKAEEIKVCVEAWSNNLSNIEEINIKDIVNNKLFEFEFNSIGQRYFELFGYNIETGLKEFSTGVVSAYEDTAGSKGGDGQESEPNVIPPFEISIKPEQDSPWTYSHQISFERFIIHVNSEQFQDAMDNNDGFASLMSHSFMVTALTRCAYDFVFDDGTFESSKLYKHFMMIVREFSKFETSPTHNDDYKDAEDDEKFSSWEEWINSTTGMFFRKINKDKKQFYEFLADFGGANDE